MNLFVKDMIIGDFKLSDYGLILASFDSNAGNDEEELGMNFETIEEFIGYNPVPKYLGAKYSEKLRPQATIVKNVCLNQEEYFTEHECREILRQLTGFYGYKQLQIYSDEYDELLYFNVRINNVSYQKIAGKVAGIILSMECDSQFAWSKEYNYTYNIIAGQTIQFYNISDDLYNYLKPTIIITSISDIEHLEIVNICDNNWTTTLDNLSANEIITMDCENETLKSSIENRIVLNDFNMHFMRFVSGINKLTINNDCKLEISYRVPRKVGLVCY